jgi:hypothetical protein
VWTQWLVVAGWLEGGEGAGAGAACCTIVWDGAVNNTDTDEVCACVLSLWVGGGEGRGGSVCCANQLGWRGCQRQWRGVNCRTGKRRQSAGACASTLKLLCCAGKAHGNRHTGAAEGQPLGGLHEL